MAYATRQDMIDRFGERELIELTDRADPPADAIIDAVLSRALNDAGELIDSYIRGRYDLPLAQDSARLVRLAGDIARYYLHDDGAPERVDAAYRDAVKFLGEVSTGKAKLDVDESPTGDSGGAQTSGPDRVFSRDTLGGY